MKLKFDENDLAAWDLYAAHALGGILTDPVAPSVGPSKVDVEVAARMADLLMLERRKRIEAGGIGR